MSKVFLYSDPHFSHKGVCHFTKADGVTKLRPWDNPDEMDEALIKNFNETVGVDDKVYFLGDVSINRRGMKVLERLNCKNRVLIKGNHDIWRLDEFTQHFRDVRAYHVLNGVILSHIPIHEDSLGRFGCNIHGHLHSNEVMKPNGFDNKTGKVTYGNEIDPRYICVCVEQTDFKPILFEDVLKRIEERGGSIGFKNGNGPTL